MNIDTGIIENYTAESLVAAQKNGERLIEVKESQMTEKQKQTKKVSLNDSRSILGKKRIARKKHLQKKRRASEQKRKAAINLDK